jgi:predicted nucleic acid-binding protein
MAERRYWDSGCFIAIVSEEAGRVDVCDPILRATQVHALEIVTSAFTITEVLHPKGGPKLAPEKRAVIKRFFRRSGILLVEVDRTLAEDAQEFYWDFGVKPKDAIHVASAIAGGCTILETYDEGLIKLDGKLGTPPLTIRKPVPLSVPKPKRPLAPPSPDLFGSST